jgi:hypothetical protein
MREMIVFELVCAAEHRFEGWFASAEEYARQGSGGLLSCPVCASSDIRKLPSAKVRTPASVEPNPPDPAAKSLPAPGANAAAKEVSLASFIQHILARTEDVGRAFPEEARKIHYEESPRRPIRGVATQEEARELVDEGIPVVSLPSPSDLH